MFSAVPVIFVHWATSSKATSVTCANFNFRWAFVNPEHASVSTLKRQVAFSNLGGNFPIYAAIFISHSHWFSAGIKITTSIFKHSIEWNNRRNLLAHISSCIATGNQLFHGLCLLHCRIHWWLTCHCLQRSLLRQFRFWHCTICGNPRIPRISHTLKHLCLLLKLLRCWEVRWHRGLPLVLEAQDKVRRNLQ